MKLKFVFGGVLLIALITLARHLDLAGLLQRIQQLGPLGPVVFIAAYVLACVAFAPGTVLTLGAGAVFGLVKGVVVVSIASILGATAAFLIGRYLARDWVGRKIAGNDKFAAVSRAVAAEGWKIVLLTRLSPVFPFNLLNYAFGLTEVSLRDYFLASWIGMLPGTVLYVYLGSLAGDLASLGARPARGPLQWAFYALGLIATVVVSLYVTRLARCALQEATQGGAAIEQKKGKGGQRQMTRLVIVAAAMLAAVSLNAAEHPKEHPTGAPGSTQQEHPPGKPAQAPEGSKAWLKQIRKEYDDAVCQAAKGKSKEPFVIHDDKLGKDWELKLIRVHKDRIVSLGDNKFFACSDFKSVKKGEKDKLDLDFFATKNPDGTWKIDKVLIHKVNGKPRYTWNEKNEMVPAND